MTREGSGATIARNIGHLAGGYTLTRILQALFLIAISVYYQQEQTGRFSVLLNTALLGAFLADAGLDQVVTREVARRRESAGSLVPALLGLRVVCTTVAMGLLSLYMLSLPGVGEGAWPIASACLMCVTTALLIFFRSLLRSHDRMDAEATAGVLERAGHVLLGWPVLHTGGDPAALLAALAAGSGIALIYAVAVSARHVARVRLAVDLWVWKRYMLLAVPFLLSALTVELLHRIDVQFLQWLADTEANGRYYIAYRIVEAAMLFPQVVAVGILPQLSVQHARGGIDAALLGRLLRPLIVLSVPVAGGLFWAFAFVAPWLGDWSRSTMVVAAMAPMLPFAYANYVLGTALAAADRQRLNLIAAVLALAVNALLNVLLIPSWGAEGAALAVVAGQATYALGMYRFLRAALPAFSMGGVMLRMLFVFLGSLPAYIGATRVATAEGTAERLATGGFVVAWVVAYGALAWWMGLIGQDEVAAVRGALRRRPAAR